MVSEPLSGGRGVKVIELPLMALMTPMCRVEDVVAPCCPLGATAIGIADTEPGHAKLVKRQKYESNFVFVKSIAHLLIYIVKGPELDDLQSFTKTSMVLKRRIETRQNQLSFRDEQTLRERPLLVDPLRLAAEAGVFRDAAYLFLRVFMAALSPNGFAIAKLHYQV